MSSKLNDYLTNLRLTNADNRPLLQAEVSWLFCYIDYLESELSRLMYLKLQESDSNTISSMSDTDNPKDTV